MSSKLIPFKKELLPPPCGFANMGATCYWNAFLQALITCTSFTEILLKNADNEKYRSNPVACAFIQLFRDLQAAECKEVSASEGSSEELRAREEAIRQNARVMGMFAARSPEIWKCINAHLRSKNKTPMKSGQQDSNEIAMLLIDSMEELEEIQDLFIHQYNVCIYCHICHEFCSQKTWEYPFFEIQPDLKSEQLEKFRGWDKDPPKDGDLQSYLMKQNSYVDRDYKCPKCGVSTERLKTTRLTKVPEILIILSKIYHQRLAAAYVPEILIPMKNQPSKKLVYQAVAQVEHSGGMGGGHYWAYAMRRQVPFASDPNNWWNLNDEGVSQTNYQLKPSEGTYMVIYNYMGIREV